MAYTILNLSIFISFILVVKYSAKAQLSPLYYSTTCPDLQSIVTDSMKQAISQDPRMGASILRLFFHDCFVNGCDASVLLDDTDTLIGEKNAFPNKNSLRGFEVIDDIKTNVEASCNGTVSCADILALAAQASVSLLGGPTWSVPLGRRDSTTASQSTANSNLPPPTATLKTLLSMFSSHGLNARDMTALSGAHTIGQAQCSSFRARIYSDTNINSTFATSLQGTCPGPKSGTGDTNLAPLDTLSPDQFDNGYFQELVAGRGVLHSDQVLYNNGSLDALVRLYSTNYLNFANDFATAMVKMGNIKPLVGSNGEIRSNCRVVNQVVNASSVSYQNK